MEATRLFAQYGSFGCFLSIGGTNPATYEANFALGKEKGAEFLIYNDFPACPGVLDKKCYRGKTKGIVNEDNYPQVLKGSTL
jgi:hypothetical protein